MGTQGEVDMSLSELQLHTQKFRDIRNNKTNLEAARPQTTKSLLPSNHLSFAPWTMVRTPVEVLQQSTEPKRVA
jgi:hypothetical protein